MDNLKKLNQLEEAKRKNDEAIKKLKQKIKEDEEKKYIAECKELEKLCRKKGIQIADIIKLLTAISDSGTEINDIISLIGDEDKNKDTQKAEVKTDDK